jgi:hypothetical protein
VADLKPGDVTTWCLKHKDRWGHNAQVTARSIVVACLNWAAEQGYLPFSPLARMKVGRMHGRERILTREGREKVLAAARNKTFRRFLLFLEQTGCRPYSEAAQITAVNSLTYPDSRAHTDWQPAAPGPDRPATMSTPGPVGIKTCPNFLVPRRRGSLVNP